MLDRYANVVYNTSSLATCRSYYKKKYSGTVRVGLRVPDLCIIVDIAYMAQRGGLGPCACLKGAEASGRLDGDERKAIHQNYQ